MTPIASSWRSRVTIGSMPSVNASEGSAPGPVPKMTRPRGHVIELHDPLRHVERMVERQRHDAGAELDAVRALAGGGEEHLGRRDHLPARRVVLAAPELVVAEPVEVLGQIQVAAELERRMLADRMMWGEEGAETQSGHESPKVSADRIVSPAHSTVSVRSDRADSSPRSRRG